MIFSVTPERRSVPPSQNRVGGSVLLVAGMNDSKNQSALTAWQIVRPPLPPPVKGRLVIWENPTWNHYDPGSKRGIEFGGSLVRSVCASIGEEELRQTQGSSPGTATRATASAFRCESTLATRSTIRSRWETAVAFLKSTLADAV